MSKQWIVPNANWARVLAQMIEDASDGDTIEVASDDARELAKHAHARMCPEKQLTFVVREATFDGT